MAVHIASKATIKINGVTIGVFPAADISPLVADLPVGEQNIPLTVKMERMSSGPFKRLLHVNIARPMVYVDTNLWFVWEHPETKMIEVFKTPIDIRCIDTNDHLKKIQEYLEAKFDTTVILEDHGLWDNLEFHNEVTHPFTNQRIKVRP